MTTAPVLRQHITLPVWGMTCAGCTASVQRSLTKLPGVYEVVVDLRTQLARVDFDPALLERERMVKAIIEAGYAVDEETPLRDETPVNTTKIAHPLRKPILFGLLGMAGLLLLYLGLVSLAEGWGHAIELLIEDAWIVGPILAGFGVQVGMYAYLKTVIHAAARGTGALTGAGGGTSTAAMVACCAHHVTDVLPLLGLSAAATFLAEYRIPFMLLGLMTNVIGIGVIGYLIVRERRHLAECAMINGQSAAPTSA